MGVRERLRDLQQQIDNLKEEVTALRKGERPLFVNSERAAHLCGVSVSWLLYRAQTGQLRGVASKTKEGSGGRWLFHLPALEQFILNLTEEGKHGRR